MASKTVHQDFLNSDAGETVRANVASARALLRTLIFALMAVEDGAINFRDGSGSCRWNSLLRQVCNRLANVRDLLGDTLATPSVDWYTPLHLAEALDAALWGISTNKQSLGLDDGEVIIATEAVIEALDRLMEDIAAESATEAA